MDTQKARGGTPRTSLGQTCSYILRKKTSMVDWEQGWELKTWSQSFSTKPAAYHHRFLTCSPEGLGPCILSWYMRQTEVWVYLSDKL